MSIGRLGFPFNVIQPTFNEVTSSFDIPMMGSIPMFPNDGIHTRIAIEMHGTRQVMFLETSTPGLKGQSGGPIFDKDGVIVAVQSKTLPLALGFDFEYTHEGRTKRAPEQFIHVGLGSHIHRVRELLTSKGISFEERD